MEQKNLATKRAAMTCIMGNAVPARRPRTPLAACLPGQELINSNLAAVDKQNAGLWCNGLSLCNQGEDRQYL